MERAQRANSETGTGFACSAKLSEALPPVANAPVVRVTQGARVARFVKMTQEARVVRFVKMTQGGRVARFGHKSSHRRAGL